MGRVDLFVLKVMSPDFTAQEEKLTLAKIVEKIGELKLEEPPGKTAIYQRLRIMIEKELINFEWEEGKKFYRITNNGITNFAKIKQTITLGTI